MPSRVTLCHLMRPDKTASAPHDNSAIYPSPVFSLCRGVSSASHLPLFLFQSAALLLLPISVRRTLRVIKSSEPLGVCLTPRFIKSSAPLSLPLSVRLPLCIFKSGASLPLGVRLTLCVVEGCAPLTPPLGLCFPVCVI